MKYRTTGLTYLTVILSVFIFTQSALACSCPPQDPNFIGPPEPCYCGPDFNDPDYDAIWKEIIREFEEDDDTLFDWLPDGQYEFDNGCVIGIDSIGLDPIGISVFCDFEI